MKSISIFPNFSLPEALTVSSVSYPILTDFRVIRIRKMLKTGQKLKKWERLFLRKNRPLIVLPSCLSHGEEEILQDWVKG